ncbi:chromosome partitioning protein, ParB family [Thermodesulfobium acidiphilum]|uniref:Chromosome partitioning protein, ParB family n=1 Tax=Thermodesulfobium acidiphilum TaxID=1794699 RepID=A0A2R4W376_THEAF|nr:ParB/RepB/Spo0J family partition protein [Thermodesulfobium acidiphilum]AWB11122.1 chromosome partitioning protein, ParB family [Thermodesulfobium acidiphilum]
MSKRGMGRGLDALLGDDNSDKVLKFVLLEKILPNPYQPRKVFDEESIFKLSESIKEHGVLQPIVVREKGQFYELISGERRVKACEKIGLSEIPAIVKEVTDDQMAILALVENLQRENLSAIDEARAYLELQDKFSMTHEEIANSVGKSRSYVTNTIRLLQLPDEVIKYIENNSLSPAHGRVLLSLKDEREILNFARRIVKDNLSVKVAEELRIEFLSNKKSIKSFSKSIKDKCKPLKSQKEVEQDEELKFIEIEISKKLKTPVHISFSGNVGRFVIEFYSKEELNNLVEKIFSIFGLED